MKPRRGYTLIEFIIVMAIFALAIGFVYFDFRRADQRSSLRRTVQQIVERLQEMRTWSVTNKQPSTLYYATGPVPTRVATYGARFNTVAPPGTPPKPVQYSWRQDNNPTNFLWERSALIEPQLPFSSSLQPWDIDIYIDQMRIYQDDAGHNLLPATRETQVGFLVPESAPLVKFGDNESGYLFQKADLFIYFGHLQFPGRCWELIIRSAGEITAKESSC